MERVGVTGWAVAAFLLVRGASRGVELAEACKTSQGSRQGPLQMTFEFYDPQKAIPSLAMEYATSTEAAVLDMVRRLKNGLYTQPPGYDAWRPSRRGA